MEHILEDFFSDLFGIVCDDILFNPIYYSQTVSQSIKLRNKIK